MSKGFVISRGGPIPIVFLYGGIGMADDLGNEIVVDDLIRELAAISAPWIEFRMSSIGGSVDEGFRLFNSLVAHSSKTRIVVDGYAHSAATIVLQAADERVAMEISEIMVHAPRGGGPYLTAKEHRRTADAIDSYMASMITAYGRHGISEETIRSWMDGNDHYFTSQQALASGLIDRIEAMPRVESASDAYRVMAMSAIGSASHRDAVAVNVINSAAPRRATTEIAKMADTENTGGSVVTPATDLAAPLAAHSRTVKAAVAKGVAAEAKRRGDISGVFQDFYDADPLNPITALHDECMDDVACDELGARRKLLAMLAAQTADPVLAPQHYAVQPQAKAPPQSSRHLGGAMLLSADASDKRAKGLQAALSIKSGLVTDRNVIDAERKGEFLSMSLIDIMAGELRASGYPVAGSREDIARRYVQSMPILAAGPSHGTDHLPAVLGNIANLSAMQGWEGSAETWSQWTQAGALNNYQTATRANIALLDKLTQMKENQEWDYGDLADVKQRITGYFYGLKYSLSIQAIVNDDLGELTRTMSGWGEAASATVGDAVWAVLFTAGTGGYGQSMDEDSTVLFHANHSNYVASGSGGAPSESTLNTARAAMLTQSDPNGRKVAAIPRYILHGPSLWSTVRKVLSSQDLNSVTVDGATGATVLTGSSNTVPAMNLVPVEEYRLVASAPAATVWVLAANRRTVEVAGVGGPVAPRAEQSMVSNTPGITYELSMPFGVAALDYRGLYLNFGA